MANSVWYGEQRLKEIEEKLFDKMTLASDFVKNEARRRCPVDTGNLRSSLNDEVIKENNEIVGRVGTNVEYAGYVEYGTKRQTAQPYLRPALLENKNQITKFLT